MEIWLDDFQLSVSRTIMWVAVYLESILAGDGEVRIRNHCTISWAEIISKFTTVTKCSSCYCWVAVISDFLRPHGLQHARLLYPSLSLGVYSNSCPLGQWCCHLTLCCPLLLLPSIFLRIRVSSNESVLCIRWSKFWNFSFSIKSFQWIFRANFL